MKIQPLLETLSRLYDVQSQLLDLANSKKSIIIQNRTDELSKVMQQESKLIKQLEGLEQERLEAALQYLNAFGMKGILGTTMTEWIQAVPLNKDKVALLDWQAKLLEVTQQLKRANDTNQALVHQALDYIDFSLELLTGAESEDATYQNPAQARSSYKNRRVFDTKA